MKDLLFAILLILGAVMNFYLGYLRGVQDTSRELLSIKEQCGVVQDVNQGGGAR